MEFAFDRVDRPLTPRLARIRRGAVRAWGLQDVTLTVGPGEAIALVGASGAGKSTLLRVIGGVLVPDVGRLETQGHVATLLATDAGLAGTLTGRENALLIGVLAGLSRADARAALPAIEAASGLGAAFDRPTMSWSEGMRARVGFATAMAATPDVLLLDEVHEALDHEFREVVEHEARALVGRGGIVVAAGHDHPLLQRLCTRALHLDRGRVVADGPFAAVQAGYLG